MYPTKNINNLINVIDYNKLIKQQTNLNEKTNIKNTETNKQKTLVKSKVSYHQKIGN